MTLIASFCVGKVPVMLGDVVTSTSLRGERRFESPSLGEIVLSPLIDAAAAPSGFCRKIVPISNNLCIAWSGRRVGAKAVAEDLRTRFGNSEVAFDEVNEFLESLTYKEARDVSLVGICASAAKVEIFGVRCIGDMNHPLVGPVYVAGSGFKHFTNSLDTYQITKGELETKNPIMVAGGLGASFLTLEALTGLTLKQQYGGGFEIVRFENGEFHRLPEATYVFWRIHHEDENEVEFEMHPTVVKVCYKKDDLIIRRSNGISDEHAPRHVMATNSLFTIPSLLGSSKTIPAGVDDLPNLNSAYTFHGFLIERSPKIYALGYAEYKRKSIEFREERGTIRCSLSEEFRGRVEAMGKRFFGNLIR